MSLIKLQSFNTADAPTWSPGLVSLASGSYSISSVIDNTVLLYTDAVARLNLGSLVTSGTGAPSIALWVLNLLDGTTYPNPPGSTAGAPPIGNLASTYTANASAAGQVLDFPAFSLLPSKFALILQNNYGATFPASGVTFSLYRYGYQVA